MSVLASFMDFNKIFRGNRGCIACTYSGHYLVYREQRRWSLDLCGFATPIFLEASEIVVRLMLLKGLQVLLHCLPTLLVGSISGGPRAPYAPHRTSRIGLYAGRWVLAARLSAGGPKQQPPALGNRRCLVLGKHLF